MISFTKELQGKRSSFVCFATYRNASSVVIDDLFAQTQTDARTFRLCSKERYEYLIQYIRKNATTII